MRIIIAVPHVCTFLSPFFDPECDRGTRSIAKKLHQKLPSSKLVLSRTRRAICDNNRKKCRHTAMRKRLQELMVNDFLILEIHSFPRGSFELPAEPELALILSRRQHDQAIQLYRYLQRKHVKIVLFEGSRINDIQTQAYENDGESILIEFRDDLSKTRLDQILNFIRRYFQTHQNYQKRV